MDFDGPEPVLECIDVPKVHLNIFVLQPSTYYNDKPFRIWKHSLKFGSIQRIIYNLIDTVELESEILSFLYVVFQCYTVNHWFRLLFGKL